MIANMEVTAAMDCEATPHSAEPAVDSPDPIPRNDTIASLRVLVVDDNADAADTVAILLRGAGHEVSVAYSGHATLQALRDTTPDVVFLDLGMPGMDGFEVARLLRAEPRHRAVKLIALSGYGQAADHERTQQAGFDGHLLKPARVEEILGILAQKRAIPGEASSAAPAS